MFKPGHLHLTSLPAPGHQAYEITLEYEVEGSGDSAQVSFSMHGSIDERDFSENFTLSRQEALNFAGFASRVARKHGLADNHLPGLRDHKDYDAMFEDLRSRLDIHSGDEDQLVAG